ncbi:T9SS type A sorting domain-containing protein [Bacteroidota bacterium]
MKKVLLFTVLITLGCISAFSQGNWYRKGDISSARYAGFGFSIGTKGYFGTGVWFNDFWEYDQATDAWTQKADYPLTIGACASFSIGTKGYVGGGQDNGGGYHNEFYEYDPATNAWTKKSDYANKFLLGVGFSIGNKGYFGTGSDGTNPFKDFWEYDPNTDAWTQKADVGTIARFRAVGFAIGGKGYIGTGANGATNYTDFYEYDPAANTWTKKADFAGAARNSASAFVIGGKGYVCCGLDATAPFYTVWEYDPQKDIWTFVMPFRGGYRELAGAFTINDMGYLVAGRFLTTDVADVWEYRPLAPGFYTFPTDTMACAGGSINLTVQGYGENAEYKWQKDGVDITTYGPDTFLTISPTTGASYGYYRCVIKNAYGADTSGSALLNISSGTPSVTAQPAEQLGCINFNAVLTIAAQSNSPIYYQWYKDGKAISGAIDSFYNIPMVKAADTGHYKCEITNVCGTDMSDSVMVHYTKPPGTPTISQAWSQLTCNQDAAAYQWLKYNTPISGATNKTHIIKEAAKYSVEITDNNGCKKVSLETLYKPSGINENNPGKVVSIFPNPSTGLFTVKLMTSQQISLKVVNLLGNVVYEEKDVDGSIVSLTLDLGHMENGIYYVLVSGENFSYADRIVIQK